MADVRQRIMSSYFRKKVPMIRFLIFGIHIYILTKTLRNTQYLQIKQDMLNYFNLHARFYRRLEHWQLDIIKELNVWVRGRKIGKRKHRQLYQRVNLTTWRSSSRTI
jgi:uncharacterized protein YydD (DUF2326 family)